MSLRLLSRLTALLLAGACTLAEPLLGAAQVGAPAELGSLGGNDSVANAINASGTVVGWAETPNYERHAFVKHPGQPMLDIAGDGGVAVAHDINDTGMVLGSVSPRVGATISSLFLWSREHGRKTVPTPVYWSPPSGALRLDGHGNILMTVYMGTLRVSMVLDPVTGAYKRLLGLPGGRDALPMAINEAGDVVGGAYDAEGRLRPVFWDATTYTVHVLPAPSGDSQSEGFATDINEAGTIVGVHATRPARAIVWTGADHRPRDFGEGQPKAINNHGVVVGDYPSSVASSVRVRLWDLVTDQHFDPPARDPRILEQALASDIDDQGIAVGQLQRAPSSFPRAAIFPPYVRVGAAGADTSLHVVP